MNYHKSCPHCGHVVTAYLVRLNSPLVAAFILFAEARIRLGRPVEKSDMQLTHSQYGNFQKLRHFALVQPSTRGGWEMTPVGWKWLSGQCAILTPAAQMGNQRLEATHPAWATHREPRREVRITDVMPREWQQRAEYAAQKAGAA